MASSNQPQSIHDFTVKVSFFVISLAKIHVLYIVCVHDDVQFQRSSFVDFILFLFLWIFGRWMVKSIYLISGNGINFMFDLALAEKRNAVFFWLGFDLWVMMLQDAKGNDVNLGIYKGKVLLIVNVASQWYALASLNTLFRSTLRVKSDAYLYWLP